MNLGLRRHWKEWQWRLHERYVAKFTFIHINKTGGSSVETALGLRFCHLTALEMQRLIGPRRWRNRFTFTVVRNPWDRVVSHYFYRRMRDRTGIRSENISFEDWVRWTYGENDPRFVHNPKMFMPQGDWLSNERGEMIVDFAARFETLETDFQTICKRIGASARLPHLKKTERGCYQEYYTPETEAIVRRWFRKDIEQFGYEY